MSTNLDIYQGYSLSFNTGVSINGVAFDLTSYSLTGYASTYLGLTGSGEYFPLLILTGSNAASGDISISLSCLETTLLPVTQLNYFVKAYNDSGCYKLMDGYLNVYSS